MCTNKQRNMTGGACNTENLFVLGETKWINCCTGPTDPNILNFIIIIIIIISTTIFINVFL